MNRLERGLLLDLEFKLIIEDRNEFGFVESAAKPHIFPWRLMPSIDEPDLGMLPDGE